MPSYQESNTCGREAELPHYTERTPLSAGHRTSNPHVYRPAHTFVDYSGSQIAISGQRWDRRTLTLIGFGFALILFGFVTGYAFDVVPNAKQRNSLRQAWKIEDDRRAEQNRKWEEDEAEHRERERQHEEMERKRKEEAERKRIDMTWEEMRASDRCLRYGTKEYHARLGNVAPGLDPLEECATKPALIHGREVLPHRCAHEGMCGAAYGHWIVYFEEKRCMPSWHDFDDKGCVEPGIKRWESRLWDLDPNDDWIEMCLSTPANISGIILNGPTNCTDYGFFQGMWGMWEIPDPNCHLVQEPIDSGVERGIVLDEAQQP